MVATKEKRLGTLCEFSPYQRAKGPQRAQNKQLLKIEKRHQNSPTSRIGRLETEWDQNEAKLRVSLYGPPEGQKGRKEFMHLTILFPFEKNSEYLNKPVSYSTNSGLKFRINKQDITQDQTDHQNNPPDSKPRLSTSNLSILKITTKIVIMDQEVDNGLELSHPEIKELTFCFEDDHFISNFELIDKFTEILELKIGFKFDWIFFVCLFWIVVSPCCALFTF